MSYRVGIVGSGFGGAVHAPAYHLHPDFEVVAIASPHNAATVAKGRNIPHSFATLGDMLRSVELDVVSIASPPYDHQAAALEALAAGKHVLCEKPFALSVAQAEAMVDAADAGGTACAVAFEFRYASAATALKQMIDNAHLAPLRQIEITRFGDELRAAALRERSPWWFSRDRGGGVANSVLPHLADLANWLAARPARSVTGMHRTANPERRDAQGTFRSDVADGVFALVDYGDGLIARITNDSTSSMNQATIAVHGEGRTAVANGPFFNDMQLFSVEPDEQSELELKPSRYAKYASLAPHMPPFLGLLDDFAQRIADGGGTAPTFRDGLAAQRILAACGYGA